MSNFNAQRGRGGQYRGSLSSFGTDQNFNNQNVLFGIAPNGRKSKFFCDHCKIWGHSIDSCYKVHGPPIQSANGGLNQNFRGNGVARSAQVQQDCSQEFGYEDQSFNHGYNHGEPQGFGYNAQHTSTPQSQHVHAMQSPPISQKQYNELIRLLFHQEMDSNPSGNRSEQGHAGFLATAGPQNEAISGAW